MTTSPPSRRKKSVSNAFDWSCAHVLLPVKCLCSFFLLFVFVSMLFWFFACTLALVQFNPLIVMLIFSFLLYSIDSIYSILSFPICHHIDFQHNTKIGAASIFFPRRFNVELRERNEKSILSIFKSTVT